MLNRQLVPIPCGATWQEPQDTLVLAAKAHRHLQPHFTPTATSTLPPLTVIVLVFQMVVFFFLRFFLSFCVWFCWLWVCQVFSNGGVFGFGFGCNVCGGEYGNFISMCF